MSTDLRGRGYRDRFLGLLLALALPLPLVAADLVFGDPAVWRSAPIRTYHVENYRLQLHFDQARGEVFGDELVTLRPLGAGFRRFYLDSSDLSIDSVSLIGAHGGAVALAHEQKEERLWITLDRDYLPAARLRVRIVYHGVPRAGLFFGNPDTNYPDRARVIWSQGETEFNHHWFPCWDYPNDMSTSETITSVPEGQVVVSNGTLAHLSRAGGTVTYDWVEHVPHSSYLTSLAVGPWRKLHDSYHGKPVDYYAPRGTDTATVRRAFHLTPDMIGFFSRLFVEYPYEQYAQVAVPDFVFGGMENVSATTLSARVLQDEQAALDDPVTEVVAHELGQHWFGDYVQARDWADIWLNEGFATYLPALYTQYRDGNDEFRLQMSSYQEAALAQDQHDYLRAIVDHHYSDDGMQMFDAITHEKGAAVLDMLRYVLDGPTASAQVARTDSPFFQALHRYLVTNAAQTTDTRDLIAAVRSATGQDLGWFFDQWVFMAGTPAYHVTAAYDAASGLETVTVTQSQHGRNVPAVFTMPVELAFHGKDRQELRLTVHNDRSPQSFAVPVGFEPLWVGFDPDGHIEKSLDFPQPLAALTAAATRDPAMMVRLWAVGELGEVTGADAAAAALIEALTHDTFYGVRVAAAAALGRLGTEEGRRALLAALHERDSRVRAAAAAALGQLPGEAPAFAALEASLRTDSSYAVRSAAASSIGKSGMPQAFDELAAARALKPELHLATALQRALAATGDPRGVDLLLADAAVGMPLPLRVGALAAFGAVHGTLSEAQQQQLTEVLSRALRDPYLPLQQTAQQLVAIRHLRQLEPELAAAAAGAPTMWQRSVARDFLDQLHGAAGVSQ